jgi:hypothetical protein
MGGREDNIKTILKQKGRERGLHSSGLGNDSWQVLENAVMNLRVP